MGWEGYIKKNESEKDAVDALESIKYSYFALAGFQ